jgi:toxin ParE1/3/4
MSRATFTFEAESDVAQITQHIAQDNLNAATAWITELQSLCALLATHPAIGENLRSRRFGMVRRHAFGNYVIYYRPADEGVLVLRVIHGAREQRKLI